MEKIGCVARRVQTIVGRHRNAASGGGPKHHSIAEVTAADGYTAEGVGFKLLSRSVGVAVTTEIARSKEAKEASEVWGLLMDQFKRGGQLRVD